MQTYKEFQPTGFDARGLNAAQYDIGEYLVVLSRNRDSGILEQSNFAVALAELGGESGEDEDGNGGPVQVHRFGHWACGWFELLLVDPRDGDKRRIAEAIANRLENYPILSDEDYSNREYEAAATYWAGMRVKDRVDWLQRYEPRTSIFAARRAELPEEIDMQRLAE